MGAEIGAEEFIESLTGYEEIAISKAFGAEVFDLANTKQTTFLRSLIFVHLKRDTGQDDRKVKEMVLAMTLGQINAYFTDPDVESGEGDAPSE